MPVASMLNFLQIFQDGRNFVLCHSQYFMQIKFNIILIVNHSKARSLKTEACDGLTLFYASAMMDWHIP